MKNPTVKELKMAAYRARTGDWSMEHTCAGKWTDLNGDN